MSDPSPSSSGRPSGLNRRRSQSQSNTPHRPPARRSLHPPSQHLYPIPSSPSYSQDNSADPAPNFHGPFHQYLPSSTTFDPRGNFVGQYAMSPHLSMAQTPFSYSHIYHHPLGTVSRDSNLRLQNIHGGFQPMMEPHVPMYPYQPPSESVSARGNFSGSPSSHYPHPQSSPPPHHPPHSSQPSAGQSLHSSFAGQTGQFHSFPPAMSSSPYPYPLSTSPPYQPQYPTPTYLQHPQHFVPSEQDAQGNWWYMPHSSAITPTSYDSSQPPYHPMTYSHGSQPDPEASYSQSVSGLPSMYPVFPFRQEGYSSHDPPSPVMPSIGSMAISPRAEPGPSPTENKSTSDRPIVRRPYHPNPPPQRSDWVMWTGNVPSDSSHDELWRFFNQSHLIIETELTALSLSDSPLATPCTGSELHLHTAIARFHGQPLRPNDSRCLRLVCRVRKKGDDLISGVGAQRGMGVHTRWIKEQKGKSHEVSQAFSSGDLDEGPTTPSSSPDQLASTRSSISLSSDEGRSHLDNLRTNTKGSSSGSYASTNSSVLTRHFPQRYFILKSLTQSDLDLSVEKGLWATQRHNEGVLDQAYRTAKEVFLIFGVNRSGEFYGYARMAGPVLRNEHRVSWASRTDSSPSPRSSMSPGTGRGYLQSETIPEEPGSPSPLSRHRTERNFFPAIEHRLVDASPLPAATPGMPKTNAPISEVMSPDEAQTPSATAHILQSAPAEVGPPRQRFSVQSQAVKHNTYRDNPQMATRPIVVDTRARPAPFELDPNAPMRAVRNVKSSTPQSVEVAEEMIGEVNREGIEEPSKEGGEGAPEDTWGTSFKIDWISTVRLPFHRTRHIRNPWNHDREVKVSRDGTELEPSTGKKLLEEWEGLSGPPQEPSTQASAGSSARDSRMSKLVPPLSVRYPEVDWGGGGMGGGAGGGRGPASRS